VVAESKTAPPGESLVSDVTDGFVIFDITGVNTRALLAMASPLDPAALAPGHCAQTLFAGVKVIVYPHGDGLRLHAERALAEWLMAWIGKAVTSFTKENVV
jgi:sarcosine oxidase gamma subunit